ncbi:MAG: hypothetical protein GF331_00955 [Chitinivibrionales bacterium]|nr:hypothetical protein [Chitinivibrionales bacterium]
MQSNIFSAAGEAYHVNHIIHASGVWEVPEEKRKNDRTHAFKLVTTVGSTYCYYKDDEAARKARAALSAMLAAAKPSVFRHRSDVLDPRHIVSIGNVVALKNPQGELTHAVIVTLATSDVRNNKVWLKYKSEETATKGRRILYAVVAKANESQGDAPQDTDDTNTAEPVAVAEGAAPASDKEGLPF